MITLSRLLSASRLLAVLFTLGGASMGRGENSAISALEKYGLVYTNERLANVPWSIHYVKLDRSRPDLTLVASKARGRVIGLERLSAQMNAIGPETGRALAAINGDFYQTENSPYAGDPRGLMIVRGEVVSAPTANPCFWLGTNGEPFIGQVDSRFSVTWPDGKQTPVGLNEDRRTDTAVLFTPTLGRSTMTRGGRELVLESDGTGSFLPLRVGRSYKARVREVRETNNTVLAKDAMVLSLGPRLLTQVPVTKAGDALTLSMNTTPDLINVETAIGGGPKLVEAGKPTPPAGKLETLPRNAPYSVRAMYERHPRSAIGFNKTHLFLVEVDGRQPGLSMGMTLEELANYLVRIGCTEAMNLDGGASSQLIVAGQVVNSPSAGRERNTATGIFVVQKAAP
jgi:hypothetical protein